DLLAEAEPLLGRIGVQVLIVERQVADLDHGAVEIVAADSAHRSGHLAVDASFTKAADDDGDSVGHGAPPFRSIDVFARKLRRGTSAPPPLMANVGRP